MRLTARAEDGDGLRLSQSACEHSQRAATVGLLRRQPRVLGPQLGVVRMLSSAIEKHAVAAMPALALVTVVAIACGGASDRVVGSTPSITEAPRRAQPAGEEVVIGEVRWPTANANSLQTMVEAYETIMVGRVEAVSLLLR